MGKSKKSFADDMSIEDRVARAKAITDKLVGHTIRLIALAENNEIVLNSDLLSSQIPRSYAANAFNDLRSSMHQLMLVRLNAIWDRATNDRESIPSVLALIDNDEVREHFAQASHETEISRGPPRYLTPVESDEIQQLLDEDWKNWCQRRAEEEKSKVFRRIRVAKWRASKAEKELLQEGLRPFRAGYVAHNLIASAINKGQPLKIQPGDEARLLRSTIHVVDCLQLALNGSDFDWEGSKRIAKRNATQLWEACSFDIPAR